MTELILNENSGLSAEQVKDYYIDYQNLNVTITEPFPTSVDSTQHIDMWMLPTGDDEVIIGEYTFDPPDRITDEVAAEMTARGYTVRRTPGWTSGGTHYTYTNAVILNNIALIPWFNNANDATALAVFQAALPGHTIQQVDCRGIIGSAGALHCIVMHVPEYSFPATPRVNVLRPDGGEVLTAGEQYEIRWSAIDSGGVTSVDIHLSIDDGASYPYTVATGLANTGSYDWTVTSVHSDQCRIKVVALRR